MLPDAPAIVIADDDWGIRMLVAMSLEPEGYEVRSAACARELDEALADGHVVLVLLDVRMGGDNGIEIARRLGAAQPELPVVFLTGWSHLLTAAESNVARDVIEKPFTIERLLATVARLSRLERQGRRQPDREGVQARALLAKRAS
jgi:two-component system, OmpR family, response regulator